MRNLATGTVLAHSAGVVISLLLLWNLVETDLLLTWAGVFIALLVLRSWHMHYCLGERVHRANARKVCWQLLAGIALTGILWFAAYVHIALIAPLTTQYIFLLLVVLIAGLSLGASVVVREYYITFLLFTLYPIAWWNLVHYWDYPFNAVLGLMLLLATGVLMVVCNGVYESYRNMLELNWVKETLAEESTALARDLKERNDELTEVRHRLSEQARVDELTGLSNRRALNERLEAELKRCARFGSPLAVIMLDVDYFKNYNDNYGHQAGDLVLRKLADVLLETAHRAGDTVARYGGEEFMLLLPGTDVLAAKAVAVRIQQALEKVAITHAYSDVAPYITVSQGLAYARPEARLSSHELIAMADEALYAAKAEGRNTIKSA
jgi:diguanylate cyclase (GGDEF)-like protein